MLVRLPKGMFLVGVNPDGSETRRALSPEEWSALDKQFLERFDPESMESRSIQQRRKAQTPGRLTPSPA